METKSSLHDHRSLREDPYPMITVPEALEMVLQTVKPTAISDLPTQTGLVLAEPVLSQTPFPPFRASIMDGYAVRSADGPGVFPVQLQSTAGAKQHQGVLHSGAVAYITTGAPVPEGADAVVQVEQTRLVPDRSDHVEIQTVKVTAGQNIRPIGSDIPVHTPLLEKGTLLGPTEVALLLSTGVFVVRAYTQPRVAVCATGNEVVQSAGDLPSSSSEQSKIIDTNTPTLVATISQTLGVTVVGEGSVIPDDPLLVEESLRRLIDRYSLVVLTGGVSMGMMDYIKPTLAKMGKVHFGRLLMKPGKPTTFATVRNSRGEDVPVFGLPGNPVSALACCHLLVLPAIQRLRGLEAAAAVPSRLSVEIASAIPLDPIRPEYHRAMVCWSSSFSSSSASSQADSSSSSSSMSKLMAYSTGAQASSRMLSWRGANALLEIPRGQGQLAAGTRVSAWVIGPIQQGPPPLWFQELSRLAPSHHGCQCGHVATSSSSSVAAAVSTTTSTISTSTSAPPASSTSSSPSSSSSLASTGSLTSSSSIATAVAAVGEQEIRVAILTVSDRVSAGLMADLSGPKAVEFVENKFRIPNKFRGVVSDRDVVPDDIDAIQRVIRQWTDREEEEIEVEDRKEEATAAAAASTNTSTTPSTSTSTTTTTASPPMTSSTSAAAPSTTPTAKAPHVILTLGGTGFAPRDNTPEAVSPLLEKQAPGLVHAMLAASFQATPMAALSRPIAGTRRKTIILTLPGSPKAVAEVLTPLIQVLPHAVKLLLDQPTPHVPVSK